MFCCCSRVDKDRSGSITNVELQQALSNGKFFKNNALYLIRTVFILNSDSNYIKGELRVIIFVINFFTHLERASMKNKIPCKIFLIEKIVLEV